jgi:hypothetical protein
LASIEALSQTVPQASSWPSTFLAAVTDEDLAAHFSISQLVPRSIRAVGEILDKEIGDGELRYSWLSLKLIETKAFLAADLLLV